MKKNKKNDAKGQLIYGAHSVSEALKAKKRKIISIYTTKIPSKAFSRIEKLLPKKRVVPIQYVSRDVLTKMVGTKDHMGLVAWVSDFIFSKQMFKPESHKNILLLDSIQDVRNLGAILRTAHCSSMDGVILCNKNGAKISPDSIKASAGLAEHLDIFVVENIKQGILQAKNSGYKVFLSAIDGKDIRNIKIQGPICLVIGNEEKGISKEIKDLGEKISLPQKSKDISYNASVAAGILMFLISFKN